MNFARPGSLKAAERVLFFKISKSQKTQKEGLKAAPSTLTH